MPIAQMLLLFQGLMELGTGLAAAVSAITATLEAARGRELTQDEVEGMLAAADISKERRKAAIAAMQD